MRYYCVTKCHHILGIHIFVKRYINTFLDYEHGISIELIGARPLIGAIFEHKLFKCIAMDCSNKKFSNKAQDIHN